MSNNGFFFLASVLNKINTTKRQEGYSNKSTSNSSSNSSSSGGSLFDNVEVVKLVVDSAPSKIDDDIAARGLLGALMSESSREINIRYPLVYSIAKAFLARIISSATMTKRLREVQQQAWCVMYDSE